MAGRNSQISRIYCALDLLEGAKQGMSVAELTSALNERGHEVGKRTVYRDLEALAAAGFPVFQSEAKGGEEGAVKWVLERDVKINQYLALTARELVALWLARGTARSLAKTPFFSDLEKAFEKIEEKVGSRGKAFLTDLTKEFVFEEGPIWGKGVEADTVETIRAARAEGQVLEAKYHSAHSRSKTKRKIGVHYLYFAKGALYLVGQDLADQKVKTFSVTRLSDCKMLDEPYSQPEGTVEDLFKASFGVFRGTNPEKIVLEFNSVLAFYIRERKWHATQYLDERPDGSVVLKLEVAITPDLLQWILGFGPDVRVLEPEGLKQRLKSLALATAEVYGARQAA